MTQYPLATRQSMPTLYGRGQQRGGFPGLQPGPPVPPQQMPPPGQGTQPPLMPGYPGVDQPRGAPPGMQPQSGMEMDPRMRQMMLAQMLQQQRGERPAGDLDAVARMMTAKYMSGRS